MRFLTMVHSLIASPHAYAALARALGAESCLKRLVCDHFHIRPGDHVVDAGCGPGLLFPYLDRVEYLGLDIDARYLAHARTRYPAARFEQRDLARAAGWEGPRQADLILAVGLLHHLSDVQASGMLRFAYQRLRPGGRLVSVDPALEPGQSLIARLLVQADRGRFVRPGRAYLDLARATFPDAALTIRHDLLRLPYTHAIIGCRKL